MSLILTHKLSKYYGSQPVLRDINLSIEKGQFVSVVGPSGCGKSTLLYSIAGFVEYEGTIERPSPLGIVFQHHALYPFMTVADNISLGLTSTSRREKQAKVDELLSVVGLAGYGPKYPWQCSGGESQRISIARAFAINPVAVLLDEPFSALDMMRREAMAEWLMGVLATHPKTVVFVTHWLDEAILLSDRVIAMADGRILCDFAIDYDRARRESFKTDLRFAELRREIRSCIFDNRTNSFQGGTCDG